MSDAQKPVREEEKQEISEKDMESVSGGVTEGGCIRPILTVPTMPLMPTIDTNI
jgi:bacteriocin-like protein